MASVSLTTWQTPPSQVSLDRQTVHLWRFRLDLPPSDISGLKQLLCSAELIRAERLLDPLRSSNFVVARGRLRQILARYLDLSPAGIEFAFGAHGKPHLANNIDNNLAFNLAHAGNLGLLAVIKGSAVGVDIEKIDPQLAFESIAPRFFSPEEAACLEQYPTTRRRRTFYRLWTRKEAGLKGNGSGFSNPTLTSQDDEWLIRSFSVGRNYLGAVAITNQPTVVQRYTFL